MADPTVSSVAHVKPARRTVKARAIHELTEFVVMFLYLLVPISLFVLHRALTLKERGIDYQFSGVAIISALILAKVMLVAEGLGLGAQFRSRPLIWPILHKSIAFAVLFILFHDLEEGVKGMLHGKGFIESIHPMPGGIVALLLVGLNLAIALVPFFAFRELSRVMGPGKLQALLFKPREREAEAEPHRGS
jgi:hypothetical protein